MALNVEREQVWVVGMEDRAGALAEKLAVLAKARADLAFAIARRAPDQPGTGVLFVTPVSGAAQEQAAEQAGFARSASLHSVRATGPDRPGLGHQVAQTVAQAGINLHGFSAAALAGQAVMHLAFDSDRDADQAVALLKKL